MADWENIPRLDPALQDEINNVQIKHNALVEAVRGYSGGSIAGKTNEVMGTREKSLISAIGQPEPAPSMLLDFASQTFFTGIRGLEQAVDPHKYLNVGRATPKWVMGPQGKLVEVPPNTLAYEYDPVTGEPTGVLIEESRTNLLTWSEDVSGWDKSGTSELEATSVPSPISGVNYLRLYALNDASSANIYRGYSISDRVNGVHTGSFFVKSAGAAVVRFQIGSRFDPYSRGVGVLHLETGEFSYSATGEFTELSASVTPFGNGEYRVSVTGAQNADAALRLYVYVYDEHGDDVDSSIAAGSGLYVTGFQIEEGSTPSSYIPTTDSQVTRAADTLYRELGGEFNPKAFTVYAEGDQSSDIGSLFYLRGDGGLSNSVRVGVPTNGGSVMYQSFNGTTNAIANLSDFPGYTVGERARVAVSIDTDKNRLVLAINGETVVRSPGGFPELYRLIIGNISGSNNSINGTSGGTVLYPHAFTETGLQELTANG